MVGHKDKHADIQHSLYVSFIVFFSQQEVGLLKKKKKKNPHCCEYRRSV